MTTTKQRYTFADLLEMPPEDETIYDILGGELVVFTSPDDPHAAVVWGLILLLGDTENAGFGRVRTAPRAVAFDYAERGLDAIDVTHPDILFVREERRMILGHRCVEGAPDLVVEVLSPSTRSDDLPGGRKWAIYERYGVPYYWIVDVEARTITQYVWHDGSFGPPLVLHPGDSLTCPLFPTLTLDIAQIFARII
jgi:Uma2 family endonuclease